MLGFITTSPEAKAAAEKLLKELQSKYKHTIFWGGGVSHCGSTESIHIMYKEGENLPSGAPREFGGFKVQYFTDY